MPALFDNKQRKALERALAECQTCKEWTDLLQKMGTPNEAKEQETQMMEQAIKAALAHDDAQRNQ